MSELSHLSYSSINLYQMCPAAWRYRYIDKVPTLPSPALAFGSAFHGTIEGLIRSRVKGDSIAPYELWAQNWSKATEQDIAWNGDLPEEHSNTGLRMLTSPDAEATIQGIRPLMDEGEPVIEKRIELHVPEVPIPIIGFIDIILEDGTVCDFKTSARAWTPEKAQQEIQPLFYLAALNQLGWNWSLKARHYVFVKTRKPQTQTFTSNYTIGGLFGVLRTIRDVWRGIESESFPMRCDSVWLCKYCDYFELCRGV